MPANRQKFLYTHVIYPLVGLFVLSVAINFFDIDKAVADYFYGLQGNRWAWKDTWLAEEFFHKGGRVGSLLLAITIFVFMVAAYCRISLIRYRRPLLYLFSAVTGSSLLVSLFKSSLAVSCPWEFERYGGNLSYSPVFEQLMLRNGAGCFPAAQASAGYAWVALYFFGLSYPSPYTSRYVYRVRWVGLVMALTFGVVLGLAQQVRGAHFMSHDLWTLAVCWFYSLTLYLLMFKKHPEFTGSGLLCR